MNAVDIIDNAQKHFDRNHDHYIKFGGLFAFLFLCLYAPIRLTIDLQNRLQEQIHYTVALQSQIEDMSKEMETYRSAFLKQKAVSNEITCLANNIYYEAGNQDQEGMAAVAQVTLNRKREGFAKTICGVVNQKSGHTCQFSWVCSPKKSVDYSLYSKAYKIAANTFVRGNADSRLRNALYYHADYVSPSWKDEKNFIRQIGSHMFYQ